MSIWFSSRTKMEIKQNRIQLTNGELITESDNGREGKAEN